ncbi:MAG: HD domain-containing protein [Candidatus Bruticola sp.]
MSKKFKEKVLRDPLYGNIAINHPLILELIDSMEFQRLRRIRQLGMCFSVFHGAEHSRFQHSIGTMWLMQRILTYWHDNRLLKVAPETILAAQAAALLHDIGHGPFSHALENAFSKVNHEELSLRIVRRLAPLFAKYSLNAEDTIAIMKGTYPQPVFHELLSSQLDVDRMDYLQRDSLYTGAKYGLFDIDRIIYTIRPFKDSEGKYCCAVDHKGCEAVEGYLFCRYFMHWQVYLHKTVRSYETLLRVILKRAHYLYETSPQSLELPRNLRFLFESSQAEDEENFLDNYLQIDDFDFYHTLKLWSQSPDEVMADLSRRFLGRRPFKAFDDPGDGPITDKIRKYVQKSLGPNWEWYFHKDTPQNLGYDIYQPGRATSPIRILDNPPNNRWKEISQASRTKAIEALSEPVRRSLLMVPRDCYQHIKPWLEKDRPYQSTMF